VSFLDHIRICNDYDPARFVPVLAAGQRLGRVERTFAESLRDFPETFVVGSSGLQLHPDLGDFDSRTAAMAKVARALRDRGAVPAWHGEEVAVAPGFGAAPAFKLERAVAPLFGVTVLGVHVNGIVRGRDGIKMWVGRRSPHKATYPALLDNLCAGGVIYGHGVRETLIKEAGEEASIPKAIAQRAMPCGAIT